MEVYRTKIARLTGSDFREVNKKVRLLYNQIKSRSKRRPYVRSAFFNKDKIFLDLFWQHLFDKKNWRDRVRRLKYFPSAIELIVNSKRKPNSRTSIVNKNEILHQFSGVTADNYFFKVNIKENTITNKRYFISVFPYSKKTFR